MPPLLKMARPKADLPAAAASGALADAEGRLALRVTPGARVEAISVEGDKVAIKVRAKPTDGAANQAVLALLAKALGLAPSRITLLRGDTGRDKLVRVDF